jgi:heme o synthase
VTRFRRLAAVTVAGVFVLIAVGGLVRATDSGLGCPGWPKCFGTWFPPFGQHGTALHHALIEYSHRLTTVLVTVLVAVLLVLAWGRHVRRRPGVAWGATATALLLVFQAALGAAVVNSELNAVIVTIHYANAMLLVAAVVFTAVAAFVDLRVYRPTGGHRGFARAAIGLTATTYALILVGTYVRARHAGPVFTDWPLMDGRVVPDLSIPLAGIQFAHRVLALLVFVWVVGVVVLAARREGDRPQVHTMAYVTAALYVAQAMLGAGLVWSRMAAGFVVAHESTGALVWGSVVTTMLLAMRLPPRGEPAAIRRALARVGAVEHVAVLPEPSDPAEDLATVHGAHISPAMSATAPWLRRAQAYVALTKPTIIVLLLITTVPAMILAKGGWPGLWLIVATLAGGTLAAGSANTINCYIDRDIDEIMRRTRRRPLPTHQVRPTSALWFGAVLGLVAFAWLALTVNLLAAALAVSAIVFYVVVYTLWMKRTTPQNIVIGGAAGAVPVLVGWAAVTGRVGLPALVLFGIVFYWTPPHVWALSMRYESDYRAAGVPMLPVVRGIAETTRQILLYTLLLFAVTLLLYPVGQMGPLYLIAAVALGGAFIYQALTLRRSRSVAQAMHLFHFSNTYLALLFAAVAADPLVRAIRT